MGDLAAAIGMTPQATSNQLQRLVDTGMLTSRRDGTRVLYQVAGPCLPDLLEMALCLVEEEEALACPPEEESEPSVLAGDGHEDEQEGQ